MSEMDQITVEILRNKFDAIVGEMHATLVGTAYSQTIGEAQECSNAVLTEDMQVVATDSLLHLPSMSATAKAVLDRFQYDLETEDVILTNDPYGGGTRVQDFTMISPVSHHDEIVCYLGVRGHVEDFGGNLRGSLNPAATELWQEGARCTPVRLYRDGRMVKDMLQTLLLNSRSPESLRLDLEAMYAAVTIGRRRLEELIDSYGLQTLLQAMGWTIEYTRRRVASLLDPWPDGGYSGSATASYDGENEAPITVDAILSVQGGRLQVDLSNAGPAAKHFINATRPATQGFVLLPIVAALGEPVPLNSGLLRSVDVVTEPGSVVDPHYPIPTGWSLDHVGCEIAYAVVDALAKFAPERSAVAVANRLLAFTIRRGVRHGDTLEQLDRLDYGSFFQGGASGTRDCDGWGMPGISATTPLPSVELYETRTKGTITRLELAVDSSGPGMWRGALGTIAQIAPARHGTDEVFLTAGTVSTSMDRQGLAGGKPGARNGIAVLEGGKVTPVEGLLIDQPLAAETEIVLSAGGGPGWGDPLQRDPARVLVDVLNGHVSADRAREDYGVVVANGKLDEAATTALRREFAQ